MWSLAHGGSPGAALRALGWDPDLPFSWGNVSSLSTSRLVCEMGTSCMSFRTWSHAGDHVAQS